MQDLWQAYHHHQVINLNVNKDMRKKRRKVWK